MNYKESKAINNSLLSYFDVEQGGNPFKFNKEYTNPSVREDTDIQKFGTAVHCFILENSKFNELYYVNSFTEEESYKKLNSYKFKDFSFEEVCKLLCVEYVNSKDAKKEETRLKHYNEHFIFLLQFKNYYEELVENKNKIMLSNLEYDKIIKIYCNISIHNLADTLIKNLTDVELELYDIINSIDCKGKLDGVNYKEKYIIDIKTTSKSSYNFEESFIKYKYGRQAAFYSELSGINKFYFIVCNTIDCSIVVYEISENTLKEEKQKLKNTLSELEFHFTSDSWNYTLNELNNNYKLIL